jgi:hypothetical protein
MKIKLKWTYAEGEYDTETMELLCIPGRIKHFGADEKGAGLCIKDGSNFCITRICMGDLESSNALCKEIVRRFNEFPDELKR